MTTKYSLKYWTAINKLLKDAQHNQDEFETSMANMRFDTPEYKQYVFEGHLKWSIRVSELQEKLAFIEENDGWN